MNYMHATASPVKGQSIEFANINRMFEHQRDDRSDIGTSKDRSADIERTAEELSGRHQFLQKLTKPNWSYEQRALGIALSFDSYLDPETTEPKKLSLGAKVLFGILQFYADFKTGEHCRPSQKALAQTMGVTERAVRKYEKELRDADLLTVTLHRRETADRSLLPPDKVNAILAELANFDPNGCAGLEPLDRNECAGLDGLDRNKRAGLEALDRNGRSCETGTGVPTTSSLNLVVVISEAHTRAFHEIACAWGKKPDAIDLNPLKLRDVGPIFESAVAIHSSEPPDIVKQAVQETLVSMAAMTTSAETTHRGGLKAAINYFSKALRGNIQRMKVEAEKERVEIAQVRESADIKLQSDRKAAEMKLGSLDKRLKTGEAASAKRAASTASASNETAAAAAPGRFHSGKPAGTVHKCFVSGEDANDLLDEIPGATYDIVRKAIRDASGEEPERMGADKQGFKAAQLADVLHWVRDRVEMQVAYATHGTPAQLCGGQVGIWGEGYGSRFENKAGAISQSLLDELRERFPHVPQQSMRNIFYEAVTSTGVCREVAGRSSWSSEKVYAWSKYGPDTQRRLEAKMNDLLARQEDEREAILHEEMPA